MAKHFNFRVVNATDSRGKSYRAYEVKVGGRKLLIDQALADLSGDLQGMIEAELQDA